jgi:hypothetical protein
VSILQGSKRRYCIPCDDYTNANPCKACGADTDLVPKENPRDRDDDDGHQYADPRDERDERRNR